MTRAAIDLVFPRRCAGCGDGLWPFCDECHGQLRVLAPPWCERCGCPAKENTDGCRYCPPQVIASARAPFAYNGPVRFAIHRLKFAGDRSVASALGAAMATLLEDSGPLPDVVTWVPLSRKRLAKRGYDQARALARVVGAKTGLPVVGYLKREADGGSQARRTGEERREALRGAYKAKEDSWVARHIGSSPWDLRVLLIDDVLTTGATAGECAEALERAGAASVELLTAARSWRGARVKARERPGSVVARGIAPR